MHPIAGINLFVYCSSGDDQYEIKIVIMAKNVFGSLNCNLKNRLCCRIAAISSSFRLSALICILSV